MKRIFISATFLLLSCAVFGQTDVTPPVLACKQSVNIYIGANCLVNLSAFDLVETLSDDSTPAHLIEIGMRKECTGTGFPVGKVSLPFTIYEIGLNSIELWAKDLAGNTSHCEVSVFLQDNLGNCDPSYSFRFESALSEGIDSILVRVNGINCKQDSFGFNISLQSPDQGPSFWVGHYSALGAAIAPSAGYNTDITAEKNINPLNGVTSFDLTLLSKHILGTEPLDSPYKIIAADANMDGKVTTFDILLLRRLILGQIDQLPHGKSWRFIPADYSFPNPNNPFMPAFPEKITVPNTVDYLPNYFEFIGIKIGDLDFSADPQR
jgi:hypothetical protein